MLIQTDGSHGADSRARYIPWKWVGRHRTVRYVMVKVVSDDAIQSASNIDFCVVVGVTRSTRF